MGDALQKNARLGKTKGPQTMKSRNDDKSFLTTNVDRTIQRLVLLASGTTHTAKGLQRSLGNTCNKRGVLEYIARACWVHTGNN